MAGADPGTLVISESGGCSLTYAVTLAPFGAFTAMASGPITDADVTSGSPAVPDGAFAVPVSANPVADGYVAALCPSGSYRCEGAPQHGGLEGMLQ